MATHRLHGPTRRDQILQFIMAYAQVNDGPTPNIHEIAAYFGLGYSTVYKHILQLIREKRLERNRDNKLIIPGAVWSPPPEPPAG